MTDATKQRVGAAAGATVALVLLTSMNFVNYLDRYILPAVQEQVKGEFHITDAQIGSLTLWFFVAYVLSSPITGFLGDRFPRKPMIVIAALGIAAMNFLTASVHSYMSLNVRHAALGVGSVGCGESDQVKQGGLCRRCEGRSGVGGSCCVGLRVMWADGGDGWRGCRRGHGAVVGSVAAAAGGEFCVRRLA